ncbi:hypothetical protein LCGC14_0915030 [marine sediment metagenome]|uniref:Uncharacterized protein n=1 Tax=marine sediment metagenome TaxID=412755 RepID=A0A0F9RZ89_9ZZZZ
MKRTYSKIGLSLAATLLAVSVSHASVVISAASVTPGLITTAKLADGAVTTPKINQDAVIEVKILDLNVTERKLADSAVTSSKLHAEALSPITLDKANGRVGIGEAAPAARLEIKPQEATLFTLQSSSQNGTAIFTVDREGNLELNSRPITAGIIISTTSGSGFAHEMSGTYVVVLSTGVTVTAEPFFFCCQMTTTGGAGSETFFAQLRYDSTDIGPEWKRDTSSTDSGSLRAISGAQTLAAGHYQFKLQMKAATGGSTDIAGPAVCTIFQN